MLTLGLMFNHRFFVFPSKNYIFRLLLYLEEQFFRAIQESDSQATVISKFIK